MDSTSLSVTRIKSDKQGIEAGRGEDCPLCGRGHFCFLIKNKAGITHKVTCYWTDPHNPPTGWEHSGTASDGRAIFVKEGYKERKRKSKRFPENINLQPLQLAGVPQWQDLMIPVEKVYVGHVVKLKPGNPGGDMLYVIHKIQGGKNGDLQVILKRFDNSLGGTVEVSLAEVAEIITHDPKTGAKEVYIEYFYSDTQKVVRRQWTDRREAYKGRTKSVLPYYLGSDSWICGKGEQVWPLYREEEVIAAINKGGIIFAIAGEHAAEALRQHLSLVATCNQGGEGGSHLVAQRLAPSFQNVNLINTIESGESSDSPQCKPFLVIWGDNDPTGESSSATLYKECYKKGIPSVVIDPTPLLAMLPPDKRNKADAFDWIEHCLQVGITQDQMHKMLESVIEEAIDQHEDEERWRKRKQAWMAPVSWYGEIGYWVPVGKGDDAHNVWQPRCNFDFVIEREVSDSKGGGFVVVAKLSESDLEERFLIRSTDCYSVETFAKAIKRGLGRYVTCNLSTRELGALLAVKQADYKKIYKGSVDKAVERYGQQPDGTWVFKNVQYTKDGELTSESETHWVFTNEISEEENIPCPCPAEPDPNALKELIDAARDVFEQKNMHQFLLVVGWVIASLHFQSIYKDEGAFPELNVYGDPGTGKTLAAEAALSLVGSNWCSDGMLSKSTVSAMYEHLKCLGSVPLIWDDPPRTRELDEFAKNLYNSKPRIVRGNRQQPHSPLGYVSNHLLGGEQDATFTRLSRVPFVLGGNPAAIPALKEVQKKASGALPSLLKLGYPKNEIKAIEIELLKLMPFAHSRVAWNMAIIVCYADAVAKMVGATENCLQWVKKNLCPTENDSENNGDSLQDFITKVQALEAKDEVGSWSKKITENGKFVAIYAESVWSAVDKNYQPATYNKKSLKALLQQVGGKVDAIITFDASRDEVLTYNRAMLQAGISTSGEPIVPNSPRTARRKAWLLPIGLFDSATTTTTTTTTINTATNVVTQVQPTIVVAKKADSTMISEDSSPITTTKTTETAFFGETGLNSNDGQEESSIHVEEHVEDEISSLTSEEDGCSKNPGCNEPQTTSNQDFDNVAKPNRSDGCT